MGLLLQHQHIYRAPPVYTGFPGGSAPKESTWKVGNLDLIPGLGRSPREGKGYPLQYSGLENSMDRIVHGVSKSWTRLSDFHFPVYMARILFLPWNFPYVVGKVK